MKFSKGKMAFAFSAVLSVGMVSHASADVYGLSYLDIDNLVLGFNAVGGGAGAYTFSTNQDAILNGVADGSSGAASCGGLFGVVTSCAPGSPHLSGTVQNAPGGVVARGEGDYTKFGTVGDYANAEAEVLSATLLGDVSTHVESISESNLHNGTGAQSNTNLSSNTSLSLTFNVGSAGTLSVAFDAVIDVLTQVTGGDLGIAQANSGATLVLQKAGNTLASWAPTGTNTVTTCFAGLTCTATETALSLNNTSSSDGSANSVSGSGSYKIDISGLTSGSYTLAFGTTTSTNLIRFEQVPLPGTLLLMGTGLLLGARATRRKK
jgi:hypothetical protein